MTMPRVGGSYHVLLTSRTPEGRVVESQSYLWISGSADYGYDANRRTVQIIPDKKTYAAGDTAKILVIARQPNTPVLCSIEGRDLKLHKVLRSTDSTAVVEVPVTAAQEPGIWVSAAFVRKGGLYQGAKYLKVPPVAHQLNV